MIQSGYSLADLQSLDAQERKRQALARALMGSMAPRPIASPGQGLMQLAGTALAANNYRNSLFPNAPGGNASSFGTRLTNFLTRGNNGGLY